MLVSSSRCHPKINIAGIEQKDYSISKIDSIQKESQLWNDTSKTYRWEDWKHAIERKELVTILSTDMSKAFDSLGHNLVIKKLKAYGLTSQ